MGTELWALVLAGASALVLLWNAAKAGMELWSRLRAPDKKQTERIETLERTVAAHRNDISELKNAVDALRLHHEDDMKESREERQLMIFGLLACLKGLNEKGCNGPVTDAINTIEKHLNKKAHE